MLNNYLITKYEINRQKFIESLNNDDYDSCSKILENDLLVFAKSFFNNYFYFEFAPFHFEIAEKLLDPNFKFVAIVTFRGAGKSTLANTIYILHQIAFRKVNFIVLLSSSEELANLHLYNIKTELENNEIFRKIFGLNNVEFNKWTQNELVINNEIRIIAKGMGTRLRGMRFKEFRPQLIVCDDIENIETAMSVVKREKNWTYFTSELLPAVSLIGAKVVVIGNILHEEGITGKIMRAIEKSEIKGTLIKVPIVINGEPTWKYAFPTLEDVERKRKEVGDDIAWKREYMLDVSASIGKFFYEFDPNIHTIEPFEIPKFWRRFVSVDYGDISPSAVYWFAVSPEGVLYVYRELYETGLKYKDLAQKIFTMSRNEKVDYIVIDSSVFAKTGYEKSGVDIMSEEFAKFNWRVPILRSNKDRLNGWRIFKQFLTQKKIFFFRTCENLIRTLPILTYDRYGQDDLDTHQEDHCADAIRYGIMSWYGETKEVAEKTEKDKLWDIIKEDIKKASKEEWNIY